jgi:hypothetical protein
MGKKLGNYTRRPCPVCGETVTNTPGQYGKCSKCFPPNPPTYWRDEFIEDFYKACTYTQRITTGDKVEIKPTAFKRSPKEVANWFYNHLQPPPSPSQGWISTTIGLPGAEEKVLCYCEHYNVFVGIYTCTDDGMEWFNNEEGVYIRSVPITHWMPLPEFQNPTPHKEGDKDFSSSQRGAITAFNPPSSLGEEYSIDRLELVDRLARSYELFQYGVSMVCDEVLDRTGALLGEVRKAAAKNKKKL